MIDYYIITVSRKKRKRQSRNSPPKAVALYSYLKQRVFNCRKDNGLVSTGHLLGCNSANNATIDIIHLHVQHVDPPTERGTIPRDGVVLATAEGGCAKHPIHQSEADCRWAYEINVQDGSTFKMDGKI